MWLNATPLTHLSLFPVFDFSHIQSPYYRSTIHSIENPKQDTDINKNLTGFLSPSFDAFSTFLHEQEENT